MTASTRFAIKLHVHQMLEAEVSASGSNAELQLHGGLFQRVWLQGEVVHKDEWMLVLSDAAAEGGQTVTVKRTAAVKELWDAVAAGSVVMVIGKFTIKKGSRTVSAHKVRVLEDGEQRLVMWAKELQELHALVYPTLLAAPPLGSAEAVAGAF